MDGDHSVERCVAIKRTIGNGLESYFNRNGLEL